MSDLKPCPFCGGKAKIWKEEGGYPWLIDEMVGCQKCEISFYTDKGKGIKKWNTRHVE